MFTKQTFWRILLGLALLGGACGAEGGHILLSDGSAFEGQLLDGNGDAARVASPWSPQPIPLRPEELRAWIRNTPPPPHAEPDFRFWFRSGDSLDGNVLGMDGDLLRLRSAWGQELRLQTDRLLRVERLPPRASLLWDGLEEPGAWGRNPTLPAHAPPLAFSAGEVLNRKGLHSSLQRDMPAPNVPATLQLSLRFEAPATTHRIFLFRNTHMADVTGAVHLHFDGTQLHVQHRGEGVFLAKESYPLRDVPGHRFDYRISFDPAAGEMWVLLNDQRFGPLNWRPRNPGPDQRLDFSLHHPIEQTAVIESLRLHRWDGHPPAYTVPPPPGTPFEARFVNGDTIAMDSLDLQDGMLRTRTAQGTPVSIPISNLARLRFLQEEGGAAAVPALELRLAGGAAKFGLSEMQFDGQHLQGRHAASPDVWRIPAAWINLLRLTRVEAPPPPPGAVTLRMMNGDRVLARPLACAEGRLLLETSWSAGPLPIPLRNIAEIPSAIPATDAWERDTLLVFWNGDRLAGRLLEVREADILLEAPWGQTLSAPRERVRELLRLRPPAAALPLDFTPAPSRQGLNFSKPSVTLPRAFRVHARLARRQGQHVQVSFTDPSGGGTPLTLAYTDQGPLLRLGQKSKSQKNPLRFPSIYTVDLWVDRDGKQVVYDLDGERFGALELPADTWPETATLHVFGLGVDLLDLYVTPITELPSIPEAEAARLHLQNGPVHILRDLEWTPERMRWTDATGTPHEAAGEALLRFQLPPGEQNPARARGRDLRIGDNGDMLRLTLALEEWDDEHLLGRSENWREALRIPPAFQGRVRVNPHSAAHAPSRFSEVWPDQSHRAGMPH